VSKIYDALKRAERERELARDPVIRERPAATAEPKTTNGKEHDDYRRLRASLLFTPAYSDLHTILVTATRHREGTTRVAVGLASALASEGDTRVLLVEANFRSPSFQRRLEMQTNGAGLAEFLSGRATAEGVISPSRERNLSLMHAGSDAAPLDCEAIAAGINRLKPQFDFIIIDAPPVNRYADVAVLAPKMDGVILVVEADQTPVVDAEAAKRSLDRVGARIFGVVLNRQRSYVPAGLQALL
jgi:capsular exopolysaccharide synthesis family protein